MPDKRVTVSVERRYCLEIDTDFIEAAVRQELKAIEQKVPSNAVIDWEISQDMLRGATVRWQEID